MARKSLLKRAVSSFTALAIATVAMPVIPAFAETGAITYSFDGYDVEYSVKNEWTDGQSIEIKITNTGDEPILNWAFKYDAEGIIEGLWNASVYDSQETSYVIKNVGWNYEIAPDASVSFGYTLSDYSGINPNNFELCAKRVDKTEGYDVQYNITNEWDTGLQGEIIITNTSEEPLEAWELSFDSTFEIDSFWNGKLLGKYDNNYVIGNESWTNCIDSGESASIGFVGMINDGIDPSLTNYKLRIVKIIGLDNESDNIERIDLDSNNIDLGYIEKLISAGLITANFDENSHIRAIDGKFSNLPLRSAEDAAYILNCASALLGNNFYADSKNIMVQSDGEQDYYRLSVSVYGIPVLGSQIILSGKNSEVTGLFSTVCRNLDALNPTATVSEEEAVNIVFNDVFTMYSNYIDALAEYSGVGKEEVIEVVKTSFEVEPMLVFYTNNDSPDLTWLVHIVNNNQIINENGETEINYNDINDYAKYVFNFINYQYYIIANGQEAGSIVRKANNSDVAWQNTFGNGKDLLYNEENELHNKPREFNVQFEVVASIPTVNYRMRDDVRNIETYQTSFSFFGLPELPGTIHRSKTSTFDNPTAVSVHANMSDIYDFYRELGRDSFDNNHSTIKVSTDYKTKNLTFLGIPIESSSLNNAYWNGSQIFIGDEGNLAACKDVLAHEYTHAVFDYVIYEIIDSNVVPWGLNYYGESGALEEAYCDIMSIFAEGKDHLDPQRWQSGEDSGTVAKSFITPIDGYAYHYNDVTSHVWDSTLNLYPDKDYGGVHVYSTIFSSAACAMMTNPDTSSVPDKTWEKIFYSSIFRLGTNSTFLDARYAVISAARTQGLSEDKIQVIKNEFDRAGIIEPESIRIVLTWEEEPRDLDSHLTGPRVNGIDRFHIFYSSKCYYIDDTYNNLNNIDFAAELDYDVTNSYGPEITTIHSYTEGDYYYYVHDFSNRYNNNSTALSESNATVKIYHGSTNVLYKLEDGSDAVFSIPLSTIATLWEVFKINIDSKRKVTIIKTNVFSNKITPSTVGD